MLKKLIEQKYREKNPDTVWVNPEYVAKINDLILRVVKGHFLPMDKAEAFIIAAISVCFKYGTGKQVEEELREILISLERAQDNSS